MAFTLQVPTIACSGCISAISLAIATLDPQAKISGDLGGKQITVETNLPEAELNAAITKLGHEVGQTSRD
ncbi:MAG: heavy-metal-associated domain-containing protein [Pseudanabaenaceae cyanobacterium bins.68]|nr:heavy-metal-associated domain-containing protein [Pseudanabaenaceae cyanobacterium bins.68]